MIQINSKNVDKVRQVACLDNSRQARKLFKSLVYFNYLEFRMRDLKYKNKIQYILERLNK